MGFYRDLLNMYEGKSFSGDKSGADIFAVLRSVSMSIACGAVDDALKNAEKLLYENLLGTDYFQSNLRDGDSFSNICQFCFKPIFYGSSLTPLISNGEYIYSKECHNITSAYLKKVGFDNSILAVTALINSVDGKCYFHSFILRDSMVYDFSNNIVMPKDKYYELMVVDEINVMNYSEYVSELSKYSDSLKDGIADLLFLSLVSLDSKKNKKLN